MRPVRRLLAASGLLALAGCAASFGEDEAWRPFGPDSPVYSPGGTLGRGPVAPGGSRLTVPRLVGEGPAAPPLREEDGNVWPDPEAPRTTLTDPDAIARGVPNVQPQRRPPRPAAPEGRPAERPGRVIVRPDGQPAVTGAGTEGVWTYGVPGRPGVGTAVPDGRGGHILLEPGGGTVIAPR